MNSFNLFVTFQFHFIPFVAISKNSRSIFMELDANMISNTNAQHELQRNRSATLSKSVSQNQFIQAVCLFIYII